jgi:hypothetical protein
MAKSILQDEKRCFITGDTEGLHKHHIYFGYNRPKSEKYGFWVWLRHDWHNTREYGVHGPQGHDLDMYLKKKCQQKFEETHSRDEFMKIIGRSYL